MHQRRRHGAEGFSPHHAGQRLQLVEGRSGGGVHQVDAEVVALAQAELDVDHVIDGVLLEASHHQDGAGQRQTGDRQQGLGGTPFEMAQDHAVALPQPAFRPGAFEQGDVVACRRIGPHGLGRWQAHGLAHAAQGAQRGGRHAGRHGAQGDAGREGVFEEGKAVKLHVQTAQQLAQPYPAGEAGKGADQHDGEHQFEVMQADLPVAVAEGLDHGDLLPLGGDQAARHDIEQKGGDAEENDREYSRHLLQLAEFLGQETMRELVLAPVGAQTAVGTEKIVEAGDSFLFARAGV